MSLTFDIWTKENAKEIADFQRENFIDCWSYQVILASIENKNFYGLVLKDGGETVSIISYTQVLDEGEIDEIVTAKNYRKKGYGKTLLKYTLDKMKGNGIKTVFLEVRESNEPAIALYGSFGFEKYGVRKEYYDGKENAILMKLQIK